MVKGCKGEDPARLFYFGAHTNVETPDEEQEIETTEEKEDEQANNKTNTTEIEKLNNNFTLCIKRTDLMIKYISNGDQKILTNTTYEITGRKTSNQRSFVTVSPFIISAISLPILWLQNCWK